MTGMGNGISKGTSDCIDRDGIISDGIDTVGG